MLVIHDSRPSRRRQGDDAGIALVTVIIVMLVGFIAAASVAASVLFAIRTNVGNRGTTQAFIAAESGRDKVVSQIANGCTSASALAATSTAAPIFSAQAYTTTGAQPTSPTGLTTTCPTKDTTYVLIRSTGTGPDGSTSTIDAVYRWTAQLSNVPGGVVTYFSGTVAQGVSHYTGDLVLRNGDWSCNVGGVLDGDLYVLSGSVSISQNCTINGDVWSNGQVTSNSSGWHINASGTSTGSVTTNGYVNLTSNGNPSIAGSISATGSVTLSAAAGGTGTVGGTVTSQSTTSINPAWTTGTVTANSPTAPVFSPTLDWLRQATKWIDLNNTSGWGTMIAGDCTKLANSGTASPYLMSLLTTGTTPLAVDFTACGKNLSATLTAGTMTRDLAIIINPNQTMTYSLGGLTAASTHQLMLVHPDGNLDDRDADGYPQPTCGTSGTMNAEDTFGTTGVVSPDIHIMIYTPCGLNGTVTASFTGQLYSNDTTHFHSGSAYTCTPMSWPSALPNVGCKIKGDGGVLDTSAVILTLGALVSQVEE